MWNIGIDAHKQRCELTAKTDDGKLVRRENFPHTPEGWRHAMRGVPAKSKVAVECVGWYQSIFDLLDELGLVGILVHAKDVTLIARSKKKTDRRDSELLVDLLRSGFLPTAHVPSKTTRELRELTRHRGDIVKAATRAKNRVHRLLERAWIPLPDASKSPPQSSTTSTWNSCWESTASASSAPQRYAPKGPGVVRKILVQGALHFKRNNPNAETKHTRLKAARGNGIARVAAAGDLLDTAYQVLKNRTPYPFADAARHKRKMTELRSMAAAAQRLSVS